MEMWFLVYVDQPEKQTRVVFFDASGQKLVLKYAIFF
jgi:hypothetical protein